MAIGENPHSNGEAFSRSLADFREITRLIVARINERAPLITINRTNIRIDGDIKKREGVQEYSRVSS